MQNAQHVKPRSKLAAAAEDHSEYHSCQPRTGHHSSHTKMIEQKTGKTFSGLISLNFCCEIWTVGSELGINNIKANPSCLVSIVRAGSEGEIVWWIFSRHTLGPSAPTERQMKKMYVIGSVLHLFYPHSSNLHTGPASQTTVLTVHLLVGIGSPIIATVPTVAKPTRC